MGQRYIEVRMPKCTVFLTAGEIATLLKNDTEIWNEAVKRGKYIIRARRQKRNKANESGSKDRTFSSR